MKFLPVLALFLAGCPKAVPPPEAPAAIKSGGPQTVPELTQVQPGLQIADLHVGDGQLALADSHVVVDYTGWVLGQTEPFDSSMRRNTPFDVELGQGLVIAGWDAGIPGMRVGGQRQLTINADLAYGARGRPPTIPPNSTLVFEVTLRDIVAPRPKAPETPMVVDPGACVKMPDGLLLCDIVPGLGAAVEAGDNVVAEYTGWLDSGRCFDSSFFRPEPLTFRVGVGEVIKGWDEGIVGMRVGGVRQLVVPWQLGYGEKGYEPAIPGRADLIFEVHLLSLR